MKKGLAMLLVAVLLAASMNGIAFAEGSLPAFTAWGSAADYLRGRTQERAEEIRFRLSDPEVLSMGEQELRHALCLAAPLISRMYVFLRYNGDGVLVDIQPTYRAGVRMLDAWKSGDVSGISPQEQVALEEAESIVTRLKAQHSSPLELERAIVDELCARLAYMTSSEMGDTGDAPGVSAAYALTRGQANCQGYSDAFYLLAGMAGFQVGFQNGYLEGEAHTWNILKADGQWYIVDVTDADTSSDAIAPDMAAYLLFNAGRDRCQGILSWPAAWEAADIADTSDGHSFFQAGLPGFGATFRDLDEMARHCYQRACAGEEDVWVMLDGYGEELSNRDISGAMKRATRQHSGAARWQSWIWSSGGGQCVLLRWTEFDPAGQFGSGELSGYLGKSLQDIVGDIEGMEALDLTEAVKYGNGTVAVSAPLDVDRVTFIGLMAPSDYRICGVAVGQSLKEALTLLEKAGWKLTNRRGIRGDLQNAQGDTLSIWSKKGDTVDRIAIYLRDEGRAD